VASEEVSQQDEPLILSWIAKSLQKITQPRSNDWIVGIIHAYHPWLDRERSAEQEQVDHGIERALLETRTNDVILVLSPIFPAVFVRLL
jgi:hypothetical protein